MKYKIRRFFTKKYFVYVNKFFKEWKEVDRKIKNGIKTGDGHLIMYLAVMIKNRLTLSGLILTSFWGISFLSILIFKLDLSTFKSMAVSWLAFCVFFIGLVFPLFKEHMDSYNNMWKNINAFSQGVSREIVLIPSFYLATIYNTHLKTN